MSGPVFRTRFTEAFGVTHPVVQGGMQWVGRAELAAAVSNAGGLGLITALTQPTPKDLVAEIERCRTLTDAPFGVNFRADQPDLADRVAFVVGEGVRLVSFAGAPTKDAVARCHDAGVVVMPTVGARRHAEKVLEMGVDAVIAQGGEGGGHTGTVPTSLLLPQVVDAVAVDIPVLGAGGFFDGRGLVAALAYGADGIAMGTRFLLTQESHVPPPVKERYTAASVFDTVVTTALDGAPQRVIRTEVIDRLERSPRLLRLPRAALAALRFRKETGTSRRDLLREGLAMRKHQDLTWSQLAMAANAPMLIKATMVDGKPEVGILPTGQVTGVIDELPSVAELMARITAEAESTLKRLS